jgi:two-component system, NarL family, response regulator LiaR
MDMVMPRMNGVEAIKIIHQRQPHVAIIAITSFEDEQLVVAAVQAGASSYLQKNVSMHELHDAVRKTFAGRRVLSPEAAQALANMASAHPVQYDLTSREKSVLVLMIEGLSNPEIGERLVISRTTVATHVSSILGKLGVKSRTEAVSLAMKNHILT